MSSKSTITSAMACAAALQLSAACSLTTKDTRSCDVTSECRETFGLGSVCGESGFCVATQPAARCDRTYPETLLSDVQSGAQRLVVGNLMDRSLAAHQARENAVELAFRQINQAGGVNGQQFGVIFCTVEENSTFDDSSRTDASVAAAMYLADIGVPAIIGPASSNDTQAVFNGLRESQMNVLVMSPSATSPTLSALEQPPSDQAPGLLWRTAPPDDLQGEAIAFDMVSMGRGAGAVTSVAVLYEQGAYGEGLKDVFTASYMRLHGQNGTTGQVSLLPFEGNAYSSHIASVQENVTIQEVLFISSRPQDVVGFLAAYDNPAETPKNIFLTDAAANSDVLNEDDPNQLIQPDFSFVRGTRPAPVTVNNPAFSSFRAAYQGLFRDDPRQHSFSAHAFDAAYLVAYGIGFAVTNAQPIVGTSVARGIRRLSGGGSNVDVGPLTWPMVLDSLANGRVVNVRGASGSLDYNLATEETESDIEVWRIGQAAGRYEPQGIYNCSVVGGTCEVLPAL